MTTIFFTGIGVGVGVSVGAGVGVGTGVSVGVGVDVGSGVLVGAGVDVGSGVFEDKMIRVGISIGIHDERKRQNKTRQKTMVLFFVRFPPIKVQCWIQVGILSYIKKINK